MESSPKKICLVSLGCPKNLVDAEMMLGSLKLEGFELTVHPEEAHAIVVNTCSFIEGSKSESIDRLLEMAEYKENGNCEWLISTGCLSQRYPEALAKKMPEVDLILGTGEFNRLPNLLKEKFSNKTPLTNPSATKIKSWVSKNQILPDPELPRIRATPPHYSYVKVSEGCSHNCSFCIIPKIRGGLNSRSMESILQEIRLGVDEGVKEFNLIAQDLNEFGRDRHDGSSLTELFQQIDRISGDFWVRPLYMYPLLFNDRLVATLQDSEHWCRYVDMPLQHIDDKILRSMRRGSSGAYIRRLLSKLRTDIPDLTLRTTFIVGYPGETDEQFESLYQFVKEVEFERLGVFTYSEEEDTDAANFSDQVPEKLKEERRHRLLTLQQDISAKRQQSLVGEKVKVLVEGPSEESEWVLTGRMASQAPDIDGITYLAEGMARPGEFLFATIAEAHEYDLVASL